MCYINFTLDSAFIPEIFLHSTPSNITFKIYNPKFSVDFPLSLQIFIGYNNNFTLDFAFSLQIFKGYINFTLLFAFIPQIFEHFPSPLSPPQKTGFPRVLVVSNVGIIMFFFFFCYFLGFSSIYQKLGSTLKTHFIFEFYIKK